MSALAGAFVEANHLTIRRRHYGFEPAIGDVVSDIAVNPERVVHDFAVNDLNDMRDLFPSGVSAADGDAAIHEGICRGVLHNRKNGSIFTRLPVVSLLEGDGNARVGQLTEKGKPFTALGYAAETLCKRKSAGIT